jgi:hypothetical protein
VPHPRQKWEVEVLEIGQKARANKQAFTSTAGYALQGVNGTCTIGAKTDRILIQGPTIWPPILSTVSPSGEILE